MTETVWKDGHGFRLRQELSMNTPYIACFKCGTRADGSNAVRPCIGHHVQMMGYGAFIRFGVAVDPKGRWKPFEVDLDLDVDGLGAYLDFIRSFPKGSRGHGDWHWRNADHDFPCVVCPGPGGEAVRRLLDAEANAIDTEVAPPKLGSGVE